MNAYAPTPWFASGLRSLSAAIARLAERLERREARRYPLEPPPCYYPVEEYLLDARDRAAHGSLWVRPFH